MSAIDPQHQTEWLFVGSDLIKGNSSPILPRIYSLSLFTVRFLGFDASICMLTQLQSGVLITSVHIL